MKIFYQIPDGSKNVHSLRARSAPDLRIEDDIKKKGGKRGIAALAFLFLFPPRIYPAASQTSDPRKHHSVAASTAARAASAKQLAAAWPRAAYARRHARPQRGASLPGAPPASAVITEGESRLLLNLLILLLRSVVGITLDAAGMSIPARGRVREKVFAPKRGWGRGWEDSIAIGYGRWAFLNYMSS